MHGSFLYFHMFHHVSILTLWIIYIYIYRRHTFPSIPHIYTYIYISLLYIHKYIPYITLHYMTLHYTTLHTYIHKCIHPSIHPSRPVIGIAWSDGPGKHWRADRHRALYRKYRVKMMRQPWDFKGFQGIPRDSKGFWGLPKSFNFGTWKNHGTGNVWEVEAHPIPEMDPLWTVSSLEWIWSIPQWFTVVGLSGGLAIQGTQVKATKTRHFFTLFT